MSFVPNIAPTQSRLKTISFFIVHIVVAGGYILYFMHKYTFSTMCLNLLNLKKKVKDLQRIEESIFSDIFYCEESICRHFDKHLPTSIHSFHPVAPVYSEPNGVCQNKYTPDVRDQF